MLRCVAVSGAWDGWEVVEKYISGQKGYEKTVTVPMIDEEKEKAHKTWYTSLYNKLFGGKHQKIEKKRKTFMYLCHTCHNSVV